jgi:predicted Kef-type K+ transport protein
LFLVCFFLQIGLDNPLTLAGLGWDLFFLVLLPVKSMGFFFLLTRFHFRSRTGLLSALSLSTYSEFGLIVLSLAVANGLAPPVFLVAVAVALSLSIFLSAPLNRHHCEAVFAATGKFRDEVDELRELQIDSAFNLYTEAGRGFANKTVEVFHQQRPDLVSLWTSGGTNRIQKS